MVEVLLMSKRLEESNVPVEIEGKEYMITNVCKDICEYLDSLDNNLEIVFTYVLVNPKYVINQNGTVVEYSSGGLNELKKIEDIVFPPIRSKLEKEMVVIYMADDINRSLEIIDEDKLHQEIKRTREESNLEESELSILVNIIDDEQSTIEKIVDMYNSGNNKPVVYEDSEDIQKFLKMLGHIKFIDEVESMLDVSINDTLELHYAIHLTNETVIDREDGTFSINKKEV